MPKTYEPIATTTLTSNASSIVFSSIPSTYTDLFLVTSTKSTQSGNNNDAIFMRFNNDTAGTNHAYSRLLGIGSTETADQTESDKFDMVYGQTNAGVGFAITTTDILSYTSTAFFKTIIINESGVGAGGNIGGMSGGTYKSTSAVNRIDLFYGAANIKSGSSATLYGITKA